MFYSMRIKIATIYINFFSNQIFFFRISSKSLINRKEAKSEMGLQFVTSAPASQHREQYMTVARAHRHTGSKNRKLNRNAVFSLPTAYQFVLIDIRTVDYIWYLYF
jgi:hypothetical protein